MKRNRLGFTVTLALALTSLLSLSGCNHKKTIWIYTSLYKEVIAEMTPELERAMPGVDIRWYHGGSENVAGKLNIELATGHTKADLILTSDPFWYYELKQYGKLLPYESPAAKGVPARFRDPDHAFVNVRMPVMVMSYNSEVMTEKDAPHSWKELTDPKWRDKVSMGSPLESGTSFTTVALWTKLYGWDILRAFRSVNLVAAGGNSSVITRIETRERPVGVVLLENIVKSEGKHSPVRPIYPTDGSVPIPSPIAILKDSANPELAKKVYDWFFSKEAQTAIIHGGMYSALPDFESPKFALPWKALDPKLVPWSPELVAEIFTKKEEIKEKFAEVVLH